MTRNKAARRHIEQHTSITIIEMSCTKCDVEDMQSTASFSAHILNTFVPRTYNGQFLNE